MSEKLGKALRDIDQEALVEEFQAIKDRSGLLYALSRLRVYVITELTKGGNDLKTWLDVMSKPVREQIRESISYQIIRLLINQGESPGNGFSLDSEKNLCISSLEHNQTLKKFLPPDLAGKLLNYESSIDSGDEEAIRQMLNEWEEVAGVPFFKNLFAIMKIRLRHLSPEFAGNYINEINEGIFAGMGYDLSTVLMTELGDEYFITTMNAGEEEMPLPLHKVDILSALGMSHAVIPTEDDFIITEEGYTLLNSVYSPFWKRVTFLESEYPLSLI